MPSLKPFTAPPRSLPMLRSFLVPKIRITTSNTITQCTQLIEPMFALLQKPRSAAGPLLVDSGNPLAPPQLGQHVLGLETMPRQQHQGVKPQIRGLSHHVQFITALGGKH